MTKLTIDREKNAQFLAKLLANFWMLKFIFDKEEIFKNSKTILNAILQNYSAFNITTIDSFTHKIVKTFAFDLKLPVNFNLEMVEKSFEAGKRLPPYSTSAR